MNTLQIHTTVLLGTRQLLLAGHLLKNCLSSYDLKEAILSSTPLRHASTFFNVIY